MTFDVEGDHVQNKPCVQCPLDHCLLRGKHGRIPMVLGALTRPCRVGQNGPGAAANLLPISLVQSVLLALQNNMDIKVERLSPLIREEEVRREAGVFSPQGWALRPAPIGP